MASSFFALLDDIAVLAKAAAASIDDIAVLTKTTADDIAILAKTAATSADDIVAGAGKAASKTAAVLIDDAAVTPQYLQGVTPARELPVVWRIARGSLINKAVVITAIMLLSIWAPWVFTWALILGGGYLAFEGAEKLLHYFEKKRSKQLEQATEEALHRSPSDENSIVRSAVTTDLVLSTEIMLISMSNFETDAWWMRLSMLLLVGLLMTVIVYGSVALLIKLDDVGAWIAKRGVIRKSDVLQKLGVGLVKAMPHAFTLLTVVGTAAMLWVGGHLLLVNFAEVGFAGTWNLVHALTKNIGNGFVFWLIDALLSAVFGFLGGLIIVAALKCAQRLTPKKQAS